MYCVRPQVNLQQPTFQTRAEGEFRPCVFGLMSFDVLNPLGEILFFFLSSIFGAQEISLMMLRCYS